MLVDPKMNFVVDDSDLSDYEDALHDMDEHVIDVHNILYKVSNKTYKITIPKPIDIIEYAKTHHNCILNANWRCTQHFRDFSVNIFKKTKWMLMTREMDEDVVKKMFFDKFGFNVVDIQVVNITVMVKLGAAVNLEQLHQMMTSTKISDVLNGYRATEDFYFLDAQTFPALIAKPYKDRDLVLEFYATGAINVTGLKSNLEIEDALHYIRNRVIPNIQRGLGRF